MGRWADLTVAVHPQPPGPLALPFRGQAAQSLYPFTPSQRENKHKWVWGTCSQFTDEETGLPKAWD